MEVSSSLTFVSNVCWASAEELCSVVDLSCGITFSPVAPLSPMVPLSSCQNYWFWLTTRGSRGARAPLAPRFLSKSWSFPAIVWEKPLLWVFFAGKTLTAGTGIFSGVFGWFNFHSCKFLCKRCVEPGSSSSLFSNSRRFSYRTREKINWNQRHPFPGTFLFLPGWSLGDKKKQTSEKHEVLMPFGLLCWQNRQ